MFLDSSNLGCRTVAHERDLLPMLRQLLDRPGKRIQSAREQDYLVRREACFFFIRKLKVLSYRRGIV